MDEPVVPPADGGLVRVRIDLAYDGTAYAGWAGQPAQRTVQGTVEDALGTVLRLGGPPRLTVAGRTDAGVHALGQVAHVDLPGSVVAAVQRLARRCNGVLPPDVRIRSVAVAPVDFDARFSARSRVYAYRVADASSAPNPLRRFDTLVHRRRLDVDRLAAAARGLLGEHDFAAYCRHRQGAGTVRRLLRLDWERDAEGVLVAVVEADAFCHSMVRSMVGALLSVGAGGHDTEWPATLLRSGVREPAAAVAPAHGLTLLKVRYPPDDELAQRAGVTRKRRDPETASPGNDVTRTPAVPDTDGSWAISTSHT